MTLTLDLSDDMLQQLRELAQQKQVSPEEAVLTLLSEHFRRAQQEERRARIKAAGDYVQHKNAELYKRLA